MPNTVNKYLEKLDSLRHEIAEVSAHLSSEDLEKPASFDEKRTMRLLLHRMSVHDMDHAQQIAMTREAFGSFLNEAQLLTSRAAISRGMLYSMLIGLSDDQLFEHPCPGEWSIAEILDHVIFADERRLNEFRRIVQEKEM